MELGTDKPLQCGNLNNFHQVRFGVYTHTLHACCFVGILEAVVELVAVTVTFLDMLGTICLVCLAAFLQNTFVGTQTHGSTTPGITGCAAEDEFVNYTKVAADYREYGERTPRDHLVVQAGAGSNMSATIPPSIDGEVVDYEEEITVDETQQNVSDDGAAGTGDGYNADDPVEDWLAEEGKSLKLLLTEWCDRAGWRLIWNTNRNYTLTAGAMFRGRFADVSSALVRAFARARPAPIATFYKGNRVLVVETMEDENAYE